MTRLPLADFPAAVKAQATLRARLDRAVSVELLRALTEGRL